MWSTVDRLLGRGQRACDRVSSDELSGFFREKMERIRSSTSGPSLPTFNPVPAGVSFTSVSSEDVAAAVSALPVESSALDPLPVPVLKSISDLLVPFLTHLFSLSLTTGHVFAGFIFSLHRSLRSLGWTRAALHLIGRYQT